MAIETSSKPKPYSTHCNPNSLFFLDETTIIINKQVTARWF
jgi:hypothetical protein